MTAYQCDICGELFNRKDRYEIGQEPLLDVKDIKNEVYHIVLQRYSRSDGSSEADICPECHNTLKIFIKKMRGEDIDGD